ncbi:MAG: ATP-dependent helicase, partial [Candidatus Gastranaerophilales bacterium]|nr:ATP-dependent helicase [Candidatus Gastranaerophilales bacterium]
TISSSDASIKEFSFIYKSYLEKLKSLSLLDYDDLLMYSVKLLKENENIREYYQEKFRYIIEDEAQDSSPIQQELIKLLSGKYNNVIRCGDVNQAILGTFSNSDVKGFKEFIANNNKVEMFRSQRCAKGIYELANKLVDKALGNPPTKDAFYDLKMQGVESKNPISQNPISYRTIEDTKKEKELMMNAIKEKSANSETPPTFGILLRTNRQVSSWATFLESQGLNVLCRGDSFRQKKVFTFILTAVELFMKPWNNKILAKFYKEFCNIDKYKFDENLFEYIEKNDKTVLEPDFIKSNHFTNKDFEPFWWEAFSIVESNTLDIQEIVIYCANTYFDDVIDKSNAFLFSILIRKYLNTLDITEKFKLNYFNEMLKYFKNLLSQKTMKGINLFSKEDEDNDFSGFVQIMTIHKSKGGEFDYVYLPEFTDFNYSLDFAKCCERIKNRKKPLLSKLDKIITGKEVLPSQSAKEEIDETLRLLYVAITRAKRGLTFSYSDKNDFNRDNKPVEFIEDLIC